MKLSYLVLADGENITAKLMGNVVSITVVDEIGFKSDTAEITLNDDASLFGLPETGAKLDIAMGLNGDLTHLGTYIVDDLSGTIFPETMTISAKAADMRGDIRAPKTRSWLEKTAQDILEQIASEHGLKPYISDSLKSHLFKYLAQTSESDANLLTRIARQLDAVFKPAGDALVLAKRGDGLGTNGQTLPVFDVAKDGMSGGSWNITGRGRYGRVVAEWSDVETGATQKVTVGDKKPELALRHRYPNEAEAKRAAEAALARSKRMSGTISVDIAGFRPELFAGAIANMTDIKPELRGEWDMTRVTHQLTSKLITRFDAERDNEDSK